MLMVLFHDSFSGSWNAETKSGRHLQRELWTRVFLVDFVFLFLYSIFVRALVVVLFACICNYMCAFVFCTSICICAMKHVMCSGIASAMLRRDLSDK